MNLEIVSPKPRYQVCYYVCMPHIHTEPDQHDMTVSAYIMRKFDNQWKGLVHFHRKTKVYMQVGGHIELNETPWQAMAHELQEESGYFLSQLKILQYNDRQQVPAKHIVHPIPMAMNTHFVGSDHFHSDICYGFVANDDPAVPVSDGESNDLRWLSKEDLISMSSTGEVVEDTASLYLDIFGSLESYKLVPADSFKVTKPTSASITYKTGNIKRS